MSRLGELLVREKMISLQQLQEAQDEAKRTGRRLGVALSRLGYVNDSDLTQFLARQYSLPSINLNDFEIDPDVLRLVPKDTSMKHMVIPVNRAGATLIVAMSDPSNIYAIDELKFLTQYNIEPVVASEGAIEEAINRYYDKGPNLEAMMEEFDEDVDFAAGEADDLNVVDLENQAGEAPVVKLCNAILLSAIKKGASDIHVEPYEKSFRVRFRIDGILHEEMRPPLRMKSPIVSRLKIMASLDIAERRLPQDGRIKLKIGKSKEMDFRVSCLPTLFGEKIVLRLLDKSTLQLDMTKLGFEENPLEHFKDAIQQPYGMILVTGPTGSGKTTTLYSALSELNQVGTNISTAEDPVEFNLPGINQVQMHEEIGLNFATALRSFLRQDPNIIMVGEIRDFETAEIAVKAALTGHLVLSTLHTNDAPSTITRLLNMGVEPFLVTASVNAVEAQRLVRKICVNCKKPYEANETERRIMGIPPDRTGAEIFRGIGCSRCLRSGYYDRVGVYEFVPFEAGLSHMVMQKATTEELHEYAAAHGAITLRDDAIAKVRDGLTTLEEALRVTRLDV